MISITIIIFCLSMSIVNNIDTEYFASKNQSLYGWGTEPYINQSDLTEISQDNFNQTLYSISTPSQNFIGQAIDLFTSSVLFLMSLVSFIVNTLINSSLGFSDFIQYLGKSCNGVAGCTRVQFVPSDIAGVMAILVNMNHLIAVGQILGKVNLRDGA